jgi:hypothetical protein
MLWHCRTVPLLWHAWELRSGAVPPTPWGNPSPPLWSAAQRGRCQLRDTVPPTPVRLTRRALEGGRRNPWMLFPWLHRAKPWRQAGGSGHPRRCQPCAAIPAPTAPRRVLLQQLRHYWSARGRDAAIPVAVPRTGLRQRPPRACPRTTTGRPTTTPLPSKPLLFGHRTRHDATTGTRFARTAVNSTALLTTPSHVEE